MRWLWFNCNGYLYLMHDCEILESLKCKWCGQPVRTRDTRRNCPASRGLGDTIASLIGYVWKKKCGPCGKRQEKLNERVPYK